MKITFNSIRFKNFLQVGNEFETFNLKNADFTVIVGKNGSGKSTILDAITYALYKKPYREKLRLPQLINNVNRKNMLVEVAFTVGNSNYVVRRGDKPAVFEIYRDKELLQTDPSIGDYQQQLEQIIGQNFKTFCQINVVGKASYVPFMELNAASRRAVVEDILDSNIYSVMQTIAKNEYKELKAENIEHEKNLAIIESKISNTKALLARYEADRTEEIKGLEKEIADLQENLKLQEGQVEVAKTWIQSKKRELDGIIPAQHREKFRELFKKHHSDMTLFTAQASSQDTLISKIDSMETCPHCLQKVDENHKKEIADKANADKAEALQNLSVAAGNYKKFEAKDDQYRELSDKIDKAEIALSNLERDTSYTKQRIEEKKSRIATLNTKQEISDMPDVAELESELTELNKKRDDLIHYMGKLNQAIKELGDDGIKANLVNKYIPIINKSLNENLEKMNMFVEFTFDNEFNETVKAVNRDLFTYHSFSEGQKMRIDLAILLTWRQIAKLRNSMTTNIFFLDEIADGSLDDDGMTEFMGILKSISDTQNTFIISHKDSTIDMFDYVIRAETVGNFTKYTHE